ncbi:hypothetical protein GLP21_12560 [Photobacterium carnosum]|uniref:Uncharacterized protein n=1 Tax=Photobacterium carnosum TaxID=2023717 RepID=A0A2N4UWB5_9GAMM|nr:MULTISPECIES: hypothetical protein [Photobacterium]MCD9475899.1 hypothetical protein [Photobacterium phosphoreum]MCD9485947.1 hypothetical protein [Photobacterium iliopiscarium]MCD9507761.1 hypothetical protein [Photobacterium phosphoreum]MCD9538117.1 hypothetical protein [Photobacterium carnosum]MCD9542595.1 hypothetical protein [Photobacterium carnosum]
MTDNQELNINSQDEFEKYNEKETIKNSIITACWEHIIKTINNVPKHLNNDDKEKLEQVITQHLKTIDNTFMAFIGTNKHGVIESILIESCSKSLSRDLINNCPKDSSIFNLLTEYRMPIIDFNLEVNDALINKLSQYYAENKYQLSFVEYVLSNIRFCFGLSNGIVNCAVLYDENKIKHHMRALDFPDKKDEIINHYCENIDIEISSLVKSFTTFLLGEYIIFNVITFNCINIAEGESFKKRFKTNLEASSTEMRDIAFRFLEFV